MREGGGRAVERSITTSPSMPETDMIGIKPAFQATKCPKAAWRASGHRRRSDRRSARPDRPAWSLVKVERQYQWYRSRQLLELRADHLTKRRQRHDRRDHNAEARSRCRSTGAATVSKSRPPIRTARRPARIRRRLVCRGDLDRNAGRSGDRARQGDLSRRRGRPAQDLAALRRRAAGHHRRRSVWSARSRPRTGGRRNHRHSCPRTGAPAPMSPPRCSVRATRRNRACRCAPSA
jgi:hypothetical protein